MYITILDITARRDSPALPWGRWPTQPSLDPTRPLPDQPPRAPAQVRSSVVGSNPLPHDIVLPQLLPVVSFSPSPLLRPRHLLVPDRLHVGLPVPLQAVAYPLVRLRASQVDLGQDLWHPPEQPPRAAHCCKVEALHVRLEVPDVHVAGYRRQQHRQADHGHNLRRGPPLGLGVADPEGCLVLGCGQGGRGPSHVVDLHGLQVGVPRGHGGGDDPQPGVLGDAGGGLDDGLDGYDHGRVVVLGRHDRVQVAPHVDDDGLYALRQLNQATGTPPPKPPTRACVGRGGRALPRLHAR
mmetsp:Transcript_40773/g.98495  ORF Transcript_40773/g.98495 Transcript_40773/m.98495 type:complete len:295 (-) Transcript_40773:298-1182(-)